LGIFAGSPTIVSSEIWSSKTYRSVAKRRSVTNLWTLIVAKMSK